MCIRAWKMNDYVAEPALNCVVGVSRVGGVTVAPELVRTFEGSDVVGF